MHTSCSSVKAAGKAMGAVASEGAFAGSLSGPRAASLQGLRGFLGVLAMPEARLQGALHGRSEAVRLQAS